MDTLLKYGGYFWLDEIMNYVYRDQPDVTSLVCKTSEYRAYLDGVASEAFCSFRSLIKTNAPLDIALEDARHYYVSRFSFNLYYAVTAISYKQFPEADRLHRNEMVMLACEKLRYNNQIDDITQELLNKNIETLFVFS